MVSNGSWEECAGLIFNPTKMTNTMMLANAPISEVQSLLWDVVSKSQISHHRYQENGVYCLWDTLDGRTFINVSCVEPSQLMLPLRISTGIPLHFKVWMPNTFTTSGMYLGKNLQPKAVSIPELFEQIAAKRLLTKLSQCVSATGTQRSKKM
jgi:hypothetical protein